MYKNFDIAKRFTKIDFELKFKHKKMSHRIYIHKKDVSYSIWESLCEPKRGQWWGM